MRFCENEICEKFNAGAALAGYERHVLVHLLSLRVRFGARTKVSTSDRTA
jgi:hypothetical protein